MPAYPGNTADQMSAAIGSVPSGTAVSAVAKRLLDYFTSGEIEPGTRLPAERQLATSLGIVDVRPGSGTYLRGNASELLPETLSWGLMLGAPRTADLIELRAQLEVFAARLAAVNLTDRELRELGRQVETMSETVNERSRFIEADLKFHLQIARGSRNQVLLDLLQSIRSLLRVWVERGLQAEDDAVNALDEHRAVYQALQTRDPDAVAAAMGAHMTTASKRLGRTIDGAPEITPEE